MILAEVGYEIWIECNRRVLKNERREVEQPAKEIEIITITGAKNYVRNELNSLQF